MKRLFTLALAFSFIGLSSFTSIDDNVAPAALRSFNKAFKSATEVNWTARDNYYKADFSLNGQYVTAYYDAQGEMMAVTRNISSLQLPITLQASLKRNFDCYWISDVVEITNEDGTNYLITVENADTKLIMKSGGNAQWNLYKKLRKS